jgi:hypothetical protein
MAPPKLDPRITLGRSIAGVQDAIIEQELFDRVQSLIKANTKKRRGPPLRSLHPYLLTGLVQDANGYALTTSAGTSRNGTTYFYYRNVAKQKYPDQPIAVSQVPAPQLEEAVLQVVRRAAQDPTIIEESIAEANRIALQEVDPRKTAIDGLRKRLVDTVQEGRSMVQKMISLDVEDSGFSKEALSGVERRWKEIESTLAQQEAELAVLQFAQLDLSVAIDAIRGFDGAFKHLEVAEKREFLHLLINKVVVHPERFEVHFFDGKAFTAARSTEKKKATHETIGVNQRFVNGYRWLPPQLNPAPNLKTSQHF